MILDKTSFSEGKPDDVAEIRTLHKRAFDRDAEPQLVDALLADDATTLDMCARVDGALVGHVLLTELQGPQKALALAPISVDPDWRDFLIGTELIRRALDMARQRGWRVVFVLGDPVFYGRFGFRSDLADCANCPFQGPNLLALELVPGALFGYTGKLVYPEPFFA